MKKLLYILPHTSTGGMPAYTAKQIQDFKKRYNISVVEVNNYSDDYIVHRNKIKDLVDFTQVFGNQESLLDLIKRENPDILYFQEVPNTFLSETTINRLSKYERWLTTHSSLTRPKDIKYRIDKIIAVNKWQKELFKDYFKTEIWEYPINYTKPVWNKSMAKKLISNFPETDGTHYLNIGLFTSGKNQAELFEIAKNDPSNCYHFVGNQAENFREYWEPLMKNKPDNCYVWGERQDVDLFYMACDEMYFTSKFELNPICVKEALSHGLPVKMRRLSTYGSDYDNNPLVNYINKPVVNIHYVNGCFIELLDWPEDEYNIQFVNRETKEVLYQTKIGTNSWAKCNCEYFVNWQVVISQSGEIVQIINQDLTDRKVLITLGSKSLGDTLAWIPYCEEFRKKHNCNMYVSTFLNHLFKSSYPQITFIEPGEEIKNIVAQYSIGWFYEGEKINKLKNPNEVKSQPLQKTASDILGLNYREIKPRIESKNREYPPTKYVTIANHSTLQAKYWNNEKGWQTIVDYLKGKGYSVVLLSKEPDNYMGNKNPEGIIHPVDYELSTIIQIIKDSDFFIGIGSGLSWLAWALDVPVVLISGFSEPYTEFLSGVIRIGAPESSCSGCFNHTKLENKNGWNWCPVHYGTERQFECTKLIKPETIIEKIKHLIK